MKKAMILIVLLVVAILSTAVLMRRGSQSVQADIPSTPLAMTNIDTVMPPSTIDSQAAASAESASVKAFIVTGANFSFAPSTITVKKGDRVKITLKNAEGFHDLKIDEFATATKRIQAGEEDTVEFTADKIGSFEYYCSVGHHRDMGMKGTLVVE